MVAISPNYTGIYRHIFRRAIGKESYVIICGDRNLGEAIRVAASWALNPKLPVSFYDASQLAKKVLLELEGLTPKKIKDVSRLLI